jgi:hypothetical protein
MLGRETPALSAREIAPRGVRHALRAQAAIRRRGQLPIISRADALPVVTLAEANADSMLNYMARISANHRDSRQLSKSPVKPKEIRNAS